MPVLRRSHTLTMRLTSPRTPGSILAASGTAALNEKRPFLLLLP